MLLCIYADILEQRNLYYVVKNSSGHTTIVLTYISIVLTAQCFVNRNSFYFACGEGLRYKSVQQ